MTSVDFDPSRPPARRGHLGLILAVIAIILIAWGIFTRIRDRSELRKATDDLAVVTVTVGKATPSPGSREVILPGTVQAWSDAPIYARTAGYLKRWVTDIGTPVKAGQLLGEIDAPEVDQQLNQAEADLATAEANSHLSNITSERYNGLLLTDSVSKQDADDRNGDAEAKKAAVASARANVARLHDLQSYERIVAPFDGIVTARNTDVGQLIAVGSGQELFHVSDTRKLRVYVQVPQANAGDMKTGISADLHFNDKPELKVPGTVVRTADAIQPTARTLLVQLEVDNADGNLLAGGYADVHFKIPIHGDVLRVPSNALLFTTEGMQIAVVGSDNKITMKTLQIGRDFGTDVEVLDGLGANDTLVINPPDSLTSGETVKIATPKDDTKKDGKKGGESSGGSSGGSGAAGGSSGGGSGSSTGGSSGGDPANMGDSNGGNGKKGVGTDPPPGKPAPDAKNSGGG